VSLVQPDSLDITDAVFRIVTEVLGREITRDDNLLKLGVDSLVATRIVVTIRTRLSLDVPLLTLFENPVMGDFADTVSELVQ
jgi:acyl carrier protein